jgi:hypothetical protein
MIVALLALELVALAVVLWLGNRRQQVEAARQIRQTTLQVALFALGKGAPLSPAPSPVAKNGAVEGTIYHPAPSGQQRVVE